MAKVLLLPSLLMTRRYNEPAALPSGFFGHECILKHTFQQAVNIIKPPAEAALLPLMIMYDIPQDGAALIEHSP